MAATSPSRNRRQVVWLSALVAAGLIAAGAPAAPAHDAHQGDLHEVTATAETTPIGAGSGKNEVDDAAIWVDPDDPARSVVIATLREQKVLEVYDLSGARRSSVDLDHTANNVDLRSGFALGGQEVPLVGVGGSGDMSFYRLDPATRELHKVSETISPPNDPHGFCMYRSRTGSFYAFGVGRQGEVLQYELAAVGDGVVPRLVRTIDMAVEPIPAGASDAAEGCAGDDEAGSLFVAEANYSIWRYGAEPADPAGANQTDRALIDVIEDRGGHFTPQVEGLAVVHDPNGEGFLLASSQGDDSYNVYRRTAPYDFIRKVRVVAGANADGCERTDGIDAAAGNLGPAFPNGIFVCQDNQNTAPAPGNQNLKYVPLELVVPLGAPVPAPPPPADQPAPPTQPPAATPPRPDGDVTPPFHARSGYWMVGSDGVVYPFGDAGGHGNASTTAAVDLEPTPQGTGYWILDASGTVHPRGAAVSYGNATGQSAGDRAVSLSGTPTGAGYWIFTERGRVIARGDATHHGDMTATKLNAGVLDSIATPTGRGYYMVAADGGIFSFGDAAYFGSMGDKTLNAPVQSLVPDPDGTGYWLVAADGGVFAFAADFRGSMGGKPLNAPVTGMVPNGDGYLMVATDGGIFNFSDLPFHGSLGATPPAKPIVAVAAL